MWLTRVSYTRVAWLAGKVYSLVCKKECTNPTTAVREMAPLTQVHGTTSVQPRPVVLYASVSAILLCAHLISREAGSKLGSTSSEYYSL